MPGHVSAPLPQALALLTVIRQLSRAARQQLPSCHVSRRFKPLNFRNTLVLTLFELKRRRLWILITQSWGDFCFGPWPPGYQQYIIRFPNHKVYICLTLRPIWRGPNNVWQVYIRFTALALTRAWLGMSVNTGLRGSFLRFPPIKGKRCI